MKLELINQSPNGKAHTTPLLFIHGKWHAAWCWAEHFLPYFAGHGYNSYALSLRAHGESEGRENLRWTSIADYVADVAQVSGQIGTDPVLIGHSMGGYITQKYLETHIAPAAVLLTSIPPSGLWPTTLQFFRRHPLIFLKAIATLRLYPIVSTPHLAREALFSAGLPGDMVTSYQERLGDESFRAYLDELGLNRVTPKCVKTPLLVIGVENDAFIPKYAIHATAAAYSTTAVFFPDTAHDVMLENTWQLVADRILEFLKERGI
jgi:pimeloyl-ACP methyl ester carboxylesterase